MNLEKWKECFKIIKHNSPIMGISKFLILKNLGYLSIESDFFLRKIIVDCT